MICHFLSVFLSYKNLNKMNERFYMKKEKIINSMLFILNNLGGQSDLHKIFKILYFADQKHLIEVNVQSGFRPGRLSHAFFL